MWQFNQANNRQSGKMHRLDKFCHIDGPPWPTCHHFANTQGNDKNVRGHPQHGAPDCLRSSHLTNVGQFLVSHTWLLLLNSPSSPPPPIFFLHPSTFTEHDMWALMSLFQQVCSLHGQRTTIVPLCKPVLGQTFTTQGIWYSVQRTVRERELVWLSSVWPRGKALGCGSGGRTQVRIHFGWTFSSKFVTYGPDFVTLIPAMT